MTERPIIKRKELVKERRVHPGLVGVVVGEITNLRSIEGADRVRIASVTVGSDRLIDIVFGGPPIEYIGARVVVALIGTPTDRGRLRRRGYRGIKSEGMICSAVELDLVPEGPDEILIISQEIPVGTPLNSIDEQIRQSWLRPQ